MAFDDLRSFLKALDEQGQLLEIDEEVLPEPDSHTVPSAVLTDCNALNSVRFSKKKVW